MHSVGRKDDYTLATAKFKESFVAVAPLLSTQICLGEKEEVIFTIVSYPVLELF